MSSITERKLPEDTAIVSTLSMEPKKLFFHFEQHEQIELAPNHAWKIEKIEPKYFNPMIERGAPDDEAIVKLVFYINQIILPLGIAVGECINKRKEDVTYDIYFDTKERSFTIENNSKETIFFPARRKQLFTTIEELTTSLLRYERTLRLGKNQRLSIVYDEDKGKRIVEKMTGKTHKKQFELLTKQLIRNLPGYRALIEYSSANIVTRNGTLTPSFLSTKEVAVIDLFGLDLVIKVEKVRSVTHQAKFAKNGKITTETTKRE
jgi:hypothetical protein